MSKISLVVLAAGIGSRYGGAKQLESVNENGATIIEHSIYDALEAGFSKFIFVIREEFREIVEENFAARLRNKADVEFVFQRSDDLPNGYSSSDREKPWGTGHALLAARNCVKENFAVINADDFYGANSFQTLANFLKSKPETTHEFAMVGFPIENTLSESGAVSRGICKLNAQGYLQNVKEATKILRVDSQIVSYNEGDCQFVIPKGTLVSMNLWGFSTEVFPQLEREFVRFLTQANLQKDEFFLPAAIDKMIAQRFCNVIVLQTQDSWLGITYREDRARVAEAIGRMAYPKILF